MIYLKDLPQHERQIAGRIARGQTLSEIAQDVGISVFEANKRLKNLLKMLGVGRRQDMIAKLFCVTARTP